RQREEGHDGHLLDSWREPPQEPRSLGVRRTHRRLPDSGGLQGQGRGRVQQDDRRSCPIMTLARTPSDYPAFLESLKERIERARVHVIRAASSETVHLYWDIGQGIAEKQAKAGWGDTAVEKLSRDLVRSFPGSRGFSARNLWRMSQFYLAHSSSEFLSQAVT